MPDKLKIVCISDTHGKLPEIPECDILLISGDICGHAGIAKKIIFGKEAYVRVNVGSQDDMDFQAQWLRNEFRQWLDKIPAKEVVACWGNHDFIGERAKELVPTDLRWHLLEDAGITLFDQKIYGSPWQKWFHNWAFNAPYGDAAGEAFLTEKYSLIPDDTDIIVAHGPPKGFGDVAPDGTSTGSMALLNRIVAVKPKITVSGHIHCGYGSWELQRGEKTAGVVCNASVLDEEYELVNKPLVFEIV